jgi:DNA polymerase-3 subunit psi
MQDPLLDPLRQRILARMGIPLWQLRARGLPDQPADAAATRQPQLTPAAEDAATPHQPLTPAAADAATPRQPVTPAAEDAATPHQPVAVPTGKLWLQAEALPAPSLLGDICQWLGIGTDEVSLFGELPEGVTPPLLWLTAPDPRWPHALVCPLKPGPAHKRALWQQCRQRQPG